MGLMKELSDLNNIYQDMYTEDQDKGYVVTAADKKGNTPAWQGYKKGVKSKTTGKPLYRSADHLKDEVEVEFEPSETVKKLVESGKFTKEEIAKIVEVDSLPSNYKNNGFTYDGTTWAVNEYYDLLKRVPKHISDSLR